MGAKVCESIPSKHSRVIDYASNGQRSDFLDVYLSAKCVFCISTSTGLDAVPQIFRRPIAYVNMAPVGYLSSVRAQTIGITKHHFSIEEGRYFALQEIFSNGAAYALQTSDYAKLGIQLMENTAEEIRAAALEMEERHNCKWSSAPDDEILQNRFRDIYRQNAIDPNTGKRIHGDIRITYGTHFLRFHPEFLT
jgi:putative glycosyltransferase (TIGR04372 family)